MAAMATAKRSIPLFDRSLFIRLSLAPFYDPTIVFDPNDKSKSPYQVGAWDWENDQRALRPQLTHLDDTSLAVYAPGGNGAVLTVGGRGARLRLANNKVEMTFRPQPRVQSVAFSPDNGMLACAGDDGSIKLWRFDGQRWLAELKLPSAHRGPVSSVAFHPTQSDILLSAGEDGAKLWRRGGEDWNADVLGAHNVRQAVFTPADANNSVKVLMAVDDGVEIWSDKGQPARKLAHDQPIQCVAVTPDGNWIVTGVGSEALVWDARTLERSPVPSLNSHSAEITSLAFSPDGRRLFTASQDFHVKVWDTTAWNVKPGDLGGDGAQAVSRELLTLEQHTDSVVSVAFFTSPKFPSLLTAGADGQAILWPSIESAK
jgi:WD40 repeat protein